MNKEPENIIGMILILLLGLLGIAWKVEGKLLDRQIKRNRARRSEWTSRF